MSTITQLVQLIGADATSAYNADKAATLAAVQADTIAKGVIDEAYEAMEAAADAAEVAAGTIREEAINAHNVKCKDIIKDMEVDGFSTVVDSVNEFKIAIDNWNGEQSAALSALVTGENKDLADFQAEVGNTIDAALGFSQGLGDGFYVEEGEELAEDIIIEGEAKAEFIPEAQVGEEGEG